jgi:hypothetical protein
MNVYKDAFHPYLKPIQELTFYPYDVICREILGFLILQPELSIQI